MKDCLPNQRSYVLQTTRGGVFLRNRRLIKPRAEEEEEGGQEDQTEEDQEEEEGPGAQEESGVSNYSRVSRGQEPEGTAGQEKALREQEQGAGVGVKGRPGAGEKAGPARLPGPRLAHAQPGSGPEEKRTYKDVLCNSPVSRRVTRSMAKV